ncbi:TolB family protein [Paenibacillus arenilitoris]|uniref:PD40 domain-containing protein n=1 Tax=Paenibacillus arenilitoris TaxID=2772299 RepID=A0A927H547_9BACL|nr:PD40 domain-containing protein [Paenibacillus arenilitoris]MBD2868158.1 PD40 domain-containing protein [Paenibacillus arenilitoris]
MMHMRGRAVLLALLPVLLWWLGGGVVHAARTDVPAAAFVRGGDLWLKEGADERKLADGPFIRNPKWSFDGEWLAFTKGEQERELWVVHAPTGRRSLVTAAGSRYFEWSPADLKLAYRTERRLQYVDARQPDKPIASADGIGNYSWLPDGKGFFASSGSELQPDGWTPVILYEIPLRALGDPDRYVTVHVLPRPSDEFFAVGTSSFKWSADGRWIAFLATPTASLSADSNTLCVVSADGVVFRTLDEMANNEQWFEWAPNDDRLAFIKGVGRDAGVNKRLKVLDVATGRSAVYTPEGFADQSLVWQGPGQIVVSRAKESARDVSLNDRDKPRLFAIELASGRQSGLTKPPAGFGDYVQAALRNRLSWVRSDGKTANALLSRPNGRRAALWIEGLDQASNYYGQWYWNEVLRLFDRR